MIIAATFPGPNHRTRRGRNERSGSAPKSIIMGVKVRSNLFLLPAVNASGKATANAKKRPKTRFRKLCIIFSRNDELCMEAMKTISTLEKVGRLLLATRPNLVTASQTRNPNPRGSNHR